MADLAVKTPQHSRTHEIVKTESDIENARSSLKNIRTPKRIRRLYAMTEIRRMACRGAGHNEIMSRLGLPPRTYYRYLALAFERNGLLLLEQDKDAMIFELSVFKDRLLAA